MNSSNESSEFNSYKSTPPTNRRVRNPFERALIDRLHKPICSPGMCKIYKKKSKCTFRWDIDQACTLVPKEIVACNSQFEPSPDPLLDKIAEEATEKFFSQEMVMPSPNESSKKLQPLLQLCSESSVQITSLSKTSVPMKDVSAQTILTLPPELPPEIEKLLEPFCTFTMEQNISGDYEISANGSLRRKLLFEEHSDMEHEDSEQTDEEVHREPRPASSYETHTPVVFSPDCQKVTKGIKRTFGTPINKASSSGEKPYRNKILNVADFEEPCFSPIVFQTPNKDLEVASTCSLASASISPVNKVTSSDEEKNNFTSPESEAMATCLDCINTEREKVGSCFCKKTPNKSVLKRSASLKENTSPRESPPPRRKGSFSFSEKLEKRSLSMSSLHRSRSVQKLDFSMDMSIDGSFHDHSQADSESSSPREPIRKTPSQEMTWSLAQETSIRHLVKLETSRSHCQDIQSSTKLGNTGVNIDDTPVKGKHISGVLTHEISKIRAPVILSPVHMSLDSSMETSDNVLSLEDKKIDFNNIDLKFLTENASQFECTANGTKSGGDSFKRIDSGFNENTTFFTNASSYYECAIKPSELTVTNASRLTNKTAMREISNVPWRRADSGFKDENSADSVPFYHNETSMKKVAGFHSSETKLEANKENIATPDFDTFLVQSSKKNEGMSMSEFFSEDMTFNCNFSSTPSKNKSKNVNS